MDRKEKKIVASFLKANFKAERLAWIEPGWGSTAGQPDVNVTVSVGGDLRELKTELKYGEMKNGLVKLKIRPIQIRFHVMAGRDNRPTAFLVGVKSQDSDDQIIYALTGRQCPMTLWTDPAPWIKVGRMKFAHSGFEAELNDAFLRILATYGIK